MVTKKNPFEGLVPKITDSDEVEAVSETSSSVEDTNAKENYKNDNY